MDVPVGGVRDARLHQDRIGHPRIELPVEVAADPSAKKRRRIAENDRSCFHRANDRACARLLRIDQHRGDRVSEFTLLAAGLDIAPACRRRHDGNADGFDDLAEL